MKKIKSITEIIIAAFDLLFIVIWIVETIQKFKTMEFLNTIWHNINLIMIILLTSTLIIIWTIGFINNKILKRKKEEEAYLNELESMLIQDKVNIKYLQLQISTGQKDLDLLTIAENFSDEGMKDLGLSPHQINKANQYFKQRYGHEPD